MRTLDVVMTRPKKSLPFSNLIMWATKQNYSHCSINWESPSLGLRLVYQATLEGVHFWPQERFLSKNIVVKTYRIKVSDAEFNAVARKAVNLSGTMYGFLSVIGSGLALLGEIIYKRLSGKNMVINAPWGDGSTTSFCSELIGYVVLQQLFPTYVGRGALDHLRPDDIDELLELLCLAYPERVELLKI